jgi:uncharacterized repeat protein (TIGR03803 family)
MRASKMLRLSASLRLDSVTRITALICCALTLVGCSQVSGGLPPAPQAANQGQLRLTGAYRQLYRFRGDPSGSGPTGLIDLNGSLYGTTTGGGTKTLGTVFVRDSAGRVRTIYSFQGGDDGAEPEGYLVLFEGVFYGTTEYGGAHGDGTVFEVGPSGKERAIYSFKGGTDGANPLLTGMVAVDGSLYGTTNAGGDTHCHHKSIIGCGIIFAVTRAGHERVVYRFKGSPDGACPSGNLIEADGALFGTTNFGGSHDAGSVYRVTPGGYLSEVYSFKGDPDGATPFAGLTLLNGNFFGTTTRGGTSKNSGAVFELSTSGAERILYSFKGAPDGALPYAGVVGYNGVLYGTTERGGSTGGSCKGNGVAGCGIIYSVTTSGTENVLHRFKGDRDGANPWATLATGKTALFGTTLAGGATNGGTIFGVAP